MKIIRVDNFNRDYRPDKIIAENVDYFYGEFIVGKLNQQWTGVEADFFFKLVEDDYKLKEIDIP